MFCVVLLVLFLLLGISLLFSFIGIGSGIVLLLFRRYVLFIRPNALFLIHWCIRAAFLLICSVWYFCSLFLLFIVTFVHWTIIIIRPVSVHSVTHLFDTIRPIPFMFYDVACSYSCLGCVLLLFCIFRWVLLFRRWVFHWLMVLFVRPLKAIVRGHWY